MRKKQDFLFIVDYIKESNLHSYPCSHENNLSKLVRSSRPVEKKARRIEETESSVPAEFDSVSECAPTHGSVHEDSRESSPIPYPKREDFFLPIPKGRVVKITHTAELIVALENEDNAVLVLREGVYRIHFSSCFIRKKTFRFMGIHMRQRKLKSFSMITELGASKRGHVRRLLGLMSLASAEFVFRIRRRTLSSEIASCTIARMGFRFCMERSPKSSIARFEIVPTKDLPSEVLAVS